MLIAINFAEDWKSRVRWASAYAQRFGVKLWLLHVEEPDAAYVEEGADLNTVREHLVEQTKTRHAELVALAKELSSKQILVEVLFEQGHPAEVIEAQAEKVAADLLIVGSRPKAMISRLLLRDIADTIRREAAEPVFIH